MRQQCYLYQYFGWPKLKETSLFYPWVSLTWISLHSRIFVNIWKIFFTSSCLHGFLIKQLQIKVIIILMFCDYKMFQCFVWENFIKRKQTELGCEVVKCKHFNSVCTSLNYLAHVHWCNCHNTTLLWSGFSLVSISSIHRQYLYAEVVWVECSCLESLC